jgi:hypothetical protein
LILLLIACGFVLFPAFTLKTNSSSGPNFIVVGLILLVPLGLISLGILGAVKTTQWASGKPRNQRRGLLRWAVPALLIVGTFIFAKGMVSNGDSRNQGRMSWSGSRISNTPKPLSVEFQIPAGQAATFTVCKQNKEDHDHMDDYMSGHVIASVNRGIEGQLVLEPISYKANVQEKVKKWRMFIVTEDNLRIPLKEAQLGAYLIPSVDSSRLARPLAGGSAFESRIAKVSASPLDNDSGKVLNLVVRYHEIPDQSTSPTIALVGRGTNWMSNFEMVQENESRSPAKSFDPQKQYQGEILFVEALQFGQDQWLSFGYRVQFGDDWDAVFDAQGDRFEVRHQSTRLLQGSSNQLHTVYDRSECRLPKGVTKAEAIEIRNQLRETLLNKPIVSSIGSAMSLFRVPVKDLGEMSTAISLQSSLPRPAVRMKFHNVKLTSKGNTTRLELHYWRESNDANLTFGTGGKFPNSSVDLLNSTTINDQGSGKDPIENHVISLELPPDMSQDEKQRIRDAVAGQWARNSLVVRPGDKHTLLSVPVAGMKDVTLSVSARPVQPNL